MLCWGLLDSIYSCENGFLSFFRIISPSLSQQKHTDCHNHPSPEKDEADPIAVNAQLSKQLHQSTGFLLQSSEDAGHRDWRNVRKNNLQNTAKEPETLPKNFNALCSSCLVQEVGTDFTIFSDNTSLLWNIFPLLEIYFGYHKPTEPPSAVTNEREFSVCDLLALGARWLTRGAFSRGPSRRSPS